MKLETKPAKRAAAHAVAGNQARAVKRLAASSGTVVHSMDGRVLSRTLADPEVHAAMERQSAARRANPQELENYYRSLGVLTAAGNLTSRYRAR